MPAEFSEEEYYGDEEDKEYDEDEGKDYGDEKDEEYDEGEGEGEGYYGDGDGEECDWEYRDGGYEEEYDESGEWYQEYEDDAMVGASDSGYETVQLASEDGSYWLNDGFDQSDGNGDPAAVMAAQALTALSLG